MELKQLRSLLAVEEAGSFSGAADILDTVQSNVSGHLSKLERELNVQLVDRRTGSLTDEGNLVAQHARRLFQELEEIYSELSNMTSMVSGRVRLGVITTAAGWLLPLILDRLARDYPKIELEVAEGTSASLQRRLSSGLVDMALLTTPLTVDGLTFSPLFEEKYVLIVNASDPLAKLESVTVAIAATRPLLVPPPHVGFREELAAVAASRGAKLNVKAQIDGLHVIAALAIAGYAPAILPSSAVTNLPTSPSASSAIAIPIVDLAPRRVGIARYRSRLESSAAKRVVEALGGAVAEAGADLPPGISALRRG